LRHFGVRGALLAALLYQLGNIAPFPFIMSKRLTLVLALLACFFAVVGVIVPAFSLVMVPFFSLVVQPIRASFKTDAGKMLKRTCRIAGFLLGFLFNPVVGLICAIVSLIAATHITSIGGTSFKLPRLNRLQWIMVVLQMHYFVYCYAVMIIAYQYGGALLAAGLFFAGWVTYVYAPLLYRKQRNHRRLFYYGHWVLLATMLGMFFIPSLAAKAILWILTGFGGATEYCIGALQKERGEYDEYAHCCAENIGHILGVLVYAVAFLLTGNLYITALLSAGFVATAMLIMKKVSPAYAGT